MLPLRTQVDALIAAAPGAKPVFLEVTDWFYDVPWEEIEPIEDRFREKFKIVLSEMVALFGMPEWALPVDREWFDRWYPESLEAAAWDREDRIFCLAVDHPDKETPVTLNLRCLTKSELAELAA
jgi:hypothetical protein